METKRAEDYIVTTTQLVMPADTNPYGNLSGGKLMHWIDICGAQAAMLYAAENVVTAAIDSVTFDKPIKLGQLATFTGTVTWVGTTSMEVRVDVTVKDHRTGTIKATNTAYTVFVSVGEDMRPRAIAPMEVNDDNRAEFEAAVKRRKYRIAARKK